MLYCLVDSGSNPFYVGRTVNPESRIKQHYKRFGTEIQMFDLEDDCDENEHEWIHYFRFIGADLQNRSFKNSPYYKATDVKTITNQIVIKIDGSRKNKLINLAEKQGLQLSGYIRKTLYEYIAKHQQ